MRAGTWLTAYGKDFDEICIKVKKEYLKEAAESLEELKKLVILPEEAEKLLNDTMDYESQKLDQQKKDNEKKK